MHFSSRLFSPLGQTFGAQSSSARTSPSISPSAFVQCPAALLAGMSEAQLSEIANHYQRAWEQAHESVAQPFPLHRRHVLPYDGDSHGIGWN